MNPARLALGFLTRIPVDAEPPAPGDLGRATWWWPAAGGVVACAVLGGLTVGSWLASPLVGAALGVAAWAAVTGGLHLDGWADCMDAWWANGDAERRRAILKDPRVGALGAAATTLLLVVKVALLAACGERGTAVPAVWAACVVSRGLLAWDVSREPAATPGAGLFSWMKAEVRPADAVASAAVGALLAAPAAWDAPLAVATGAFVAALVGPIWCGAWRSRIGGSNGDVLGAGVELREAVVLFACAGPLV